MFVLDPKSHTPLVTQIVAGFRLMVDDGSLRAGAKAPSIRQFAHANGVSVYTVVDAYDRLVALGYFQSQAHSGFFVRSRASKGSAATASGTQYSFDSMWYLSRIFENRGLRSKPGCGWLPGDWLFAEGIRRGQRALAAEEIDLGGYGEPKGYLPLRQLVRDLLAAREIVAGVDQVVLTQGSSQAMDLAARNLVRPGDAVLVDAPGYANLLFSLRFLGARRSSDLSDSKTGIDDNTMKTPFSGGTGLIQSGATTPLAVNTAAWTTIFWAFLIGLYFVITSHWTIGVIMLVGGVSIVFYTTHFAKVLMGEFLAGLSLGSLVVIGSYVAMVASPGDPARALFPANVVLISIPPGILTALLLFLNEFPDMEADRAGGRFHLVVWLGRKKASYLYVAGLAMTYISILIVPLFGYSSWWLLLGFLTLPLAVKAGATALNHHDDMKKLVPALGVNVIVVLATDFLLAVGVFIEMITM